MNYVSIRNFLDTSTMCQARCWCCREECDVVLAFRSLQLIEETNGEFTTERVGLVLRWRGIQGSLGMKGQGNFLEMTAL